MAKSNENRFEIGEDWTMLECMMRLCHEAGRKVAYDTRPTNKFTSQLDGLVDELMRKKSDA